MIPCGFEPFALDAAFEGCFLFEQVQRYAVEQGEVLRRMPCSFSVQVFAKANVEHSVQLVFDAPVLTNGPIQPHRVGLEASDVVTDFAFCFACSLVVPLRFNPHQPL